MYNKISEQIDRLWMHTIKVENYNASANKIVLRRQNICGTYHADKLLQILETLTPETTNVQETEKSPSNLIWNQIEPAKAC